MSYINDLLCYLNKAYKNTPHKIYFDGTKYIFEIENFSMTSTHSIDDLTSKVLNTLKNTPKEIFPERYYEICQSLSKKIPFDIIPSYKELKESKVKILPSGHDSDYITDLIINKKYKKIQYEISKNEKIDFKEYAYFKGIYIGNQNSLYVSGLKYADIIMELI